MNGALLKRPFFIVFLAAMKSWLPLLSIALISSACGLQKETAQKPHEDLRFEHETLAEGIPVESEPQPATKDIAKAKSSSLADLYDFVEDWEGTPHVMGGMTKKGVDCSGFVILAYRDVLESNFRHRRAEDIYSEMDEVEPSDLRSGDLVFFKIQGRRIDHVGIYLEEGRFAHVSSSRGVMISSLEEAYFAKRFYKAGRKSN